MDSKTQQMIDVMINDTKKNVTPDTIVCGAWPYYAYKTSIWRHQKPAVLQLHKAFWDNGYTVNGYKPPEVRLSEDGKTV